MKRSPASGRCADVGHGSTILPVVCRSRVAVPRPLRPVPVRPPRRRRRGPGEHDGRVRGGRRPRLPLPRDRRARHLRRRARRLPRRRPVAHVRPAGPDPRAAVVARCDRRGSTARSPSPSSTTCSARSPSARINIDCKADAGRRAARRELIRPHGRLDRVCVGGVLATAACVSSRSALGPELCTSMGPVEIGAAALPPASSAGGRLPTSRAQVPLTPGHPGRRRGVRPRCPPSGASQVHVWTIDDPDEMDRAPRPRRRRHHDRPPGGAEGRCWCAEASGSTDGRVAPSVPELAAHLRQVGPTAEGSWRWLTRTADDDRRPAVPDRPGLAAGRRLAATQAGMDVFARRERRRRGHRHQRRRSPSPPPTCAAWAATSSPSCTTAGGRAGRAQRVGPRRLGRRCRAPACRGPRVMPFRHDIRTVTVPGCVDGWLALHERYGRLRSADVLAPAIGYAGGRLPGLSPARRLAGPLDDVAAERLAELGEQAAGPARSCADPVSPARCGRSPPAVGTASTAASSATACWPSAPATSPTPTSTRRQADWVEPLGARRLGSPHLDGAAELAGLPDARRGVDRRRPRRCPTTPTTPRGPTSSSRPPSRPASTDPTSSHDDADGDGPVDPSASCPAARRSASTSSANRRVRAGGRRRHHLPVHRRRRPAWASRSSSRTRPGFGSWLVEPAPASTSTTVASASRSSPVTRPSTDRAGGRPTRCARRSSPTATARCAAVLGTMGGDGQPQILLQVLARLLQARPDGRPRPIGRRALACCRARRPASTRGPSRVGPASPSRTTPRRPGRRATPPRPRRDGAPPSSTRSATPIHRRRARGTLAAAADPRAPLPHRRPPSATEPSPVHRTVIERTSAAG